MTWVKTRQRLEACRKFGRRRCRRRKQGPGLVGEREEVRGKKEKGRETEKERKTGQTRPDQTRPAFGLLKKTKKTKKTTNLRRREKKGSTIRPADLSLTLSVPSIARLQTPRSSLRIRISPLLVAPTNSGESASARVLDVENGRISKDNIPSQRHFSTQ